MEYWTFLMQVPWSRQYQCSSFKVSASIPPTQNTRVFNQHTQQHLGKLINVMALAVREEMVKE
jgi:hypothetical protein